MTAVRLVNLVKKFGSTLAVNGVTLEINSGDFVVLLGPSGCGKTTTLRCIAGLETADSGDIFIGNTRANDLPPKDRDVAMVFQSYALYPHMSVRDNLAFPLKMRKKQKNEIEARVQEVAKLLNIAHLLARKPRQLSGGEQQRVALGRALVRQPEVFLMDEPLSNLDAKLRVYTRTEIKRLHEELKITTIYVTHDQAEAMSMADKIAIMNQGNVVQYDYPLMIYGKPASTFVAGFVGSPPTNFVRATVVDGNSKLTLDAGSFKYTLPNSISDLLKDHLSNNEVLLGVRPEDLVVSTNRMGHSMFEAEIYVVEPLGANTVIDLKVGDSILKSVSQGTFKAEIGEKVWVGFAPDRVHIFDASSGNLVV